MDKTHTIFDPETGLLHGAQRLWQVYLFGVGVYYFHGCSVRGLLVRNAAT